MSTVQIPLTKGFVATVDEADLPLIAPYKWRASQAGSKWYAVATVPNSGKRSRSFYMHRMLMGNPSGKLIDHHDGDGLNNRRGNLRVTDKRGNGANSRLQARNKSGAKGVHWDARGSKWLARITVNGKSRYLGRFADRAAAAAAYAKAAYEAHGEFANPVVAQAGPAAGKTICLFVPPRGF